MREGDHHEKFCEGVLWRLFRLSFLGPVVWWHEHTHSRAPISASCLGVGAIITCTFHMQHSKNKCVTTMQVGPTRIAIVSGGAQTELRHVFGSKQIETLFLEICGSPTTKPVHVEALCRKYAFLPTSSPPKLSPP